MGPHPVRGPGAALARYTRVVTCLPPATWVALGVAAGAALAGGCRAAAPPVAPPGHGPAVTVEAEPESIDPAIDEASAAEELRAAWRARFRATIEALHRSQAAGAEREPRPVYGRPDVRGLPRKWRTDSDIEPAEELAIVAQAIDPTRDGEAFRADQQLLGNVASKRHECTYAWLRVRLSDVVDEVAFDRITVLLATDTTVETAEALERALATRPGHWDRLAIAHALCRDELPIDLLRVCEAWQAEGDPEVRRVLADAITTQTRAWLRRCAYSPDVERLARSWAGEGNPADARWLASRILRSVPENEDALLAASDAPGQDDEAPSARAVAVGRLGELAALGSARAFARVQAAMEDDADLVRGSSLQALACVAERRDIRGPTLEAALARVARRDVNGYCAHALEDLRALLARPPG